MCGEEGCAIQARLLGFAPFQGYSAGRATSLEREVRLAPTEKLAMSIADGMVSEKYQEGLE